MRIADIFSPRCAHNADIARLRQWMYEMENRVQVLELENQFLKNQIQFDSARMHSWLKNEMAAMAQGVSSQCTKYTQSYGEALSKALGETFKVLSGGKLTRGT